MIGKTMINFKPRTTKMNRQLLQRFSLLMVFLAAGCTHSTASENVNYFEIDDFSAGETIVDPMSANESQPTNTQLVNYRQGAADYREFGERTPRDQDIVISSGASNISASIPPTIEEEVVDYEAEINAAMEASESADGEETMASGEDAVEDWLAEEGSTLKGLLTDWSERAGWRLIWDSNRNYTLAAGAMFRGRFADVSSALIRTFARARPAPVATFYKGNRVLVVETMEDENAYE